jgi:hypothetical protein
MLQAELEAKALEILDQNGQIAAIAGKGSG